MIKTKLDGEFGRINKHLLSQADILKNYRAYKGEWFDSHIVKGSGTKTLMAPWHFVVYITAKMAASSNTLHQLHDSHKHTDTHISLKKFLPYVAVPQHYTPILDLS